MRIWAACACSLVLLGSVPAAAATVALRVETDGSAATSACPPEPELRERVRTRLGYDPFAGTERGAELQARVVFERERSSVAADIEAFTSSDVTGPSDGESEEMSAGRRGVPPGPRLLGRQRILSRSGNCDELATAVALAISLVIEQFESTQAEHDGAALRPIGQAPREVTTPAEPRAAGARRPGRKRRDDDRPFAWATSAGGTIVFGVAPSADPALQLRVAARRAWWSLALEGRLFAPTTTTTSAGTVRTEVHNVSAMFCAHGTVVLVCPFAGGGELIGVGTSARGTREGASLRLALGVRAGIEWRFGSVFGVQPYLEGAVSPMPTTLYLGREAVWTSPLVQGAFGLDWITHFDAGRGSVTRH